MIETIMRQILMWSAIINLGLLLCWWLFFALAHDFLYRMHTKWFRIPAEQFDAIHYTGMMYFKLFILVTNIVPYGVLLIIS